MESLSNTLTFLRLDSWVIQVFLVVFSTLLLNFFLKKILVSIHASLAKRKSFWNDTSIDTMLAPLSLLIWVVGLTFAAQIVSVKTTAPIFLFVPLMRTLGVIFCIAWLLVRFIRSVEANMIERKKQQNITYDRTTIDAVAKLMRASVIITAFIVAVQSLGYSISGVLAFGGVGGIVVGFAAKDLLANFFGGLMIYLTALFSRGMDKVA